MALAQQKWAESAGYYQKAMQLAPAFSFAGANRTLALYAGGQTNEAMREMRYRLNLYFPAVHIAVGAAELLHAFGMKYLTLLTFRKYAEGSTAAPRLLLRSWSAAEGAPGVIHGCVWHLSFCTLFERTQCLLLVL